MAREKKKQQRKATIGDVIMKKLLLGLCLLAYSALAAGPEADLQKYIKIIRDNIFKDYKGMFKPAKGNLKYPFITPGSSSYQDQLWDWDSWLVDVALRQILMENGTPKDKADALQYEQGCVLNFLEHGKSIGVIPIVIPANGKGLTEESDPLQNNMHKPCLAQHAAFLVKLNDGNAEWLRDKFYPLQAFVNCYYNHYRNRATGLYYWQTDCAIGVDNDPCTFFRPPASSGSILLNCFMYRELQAMVYLAAQLNMQEIGASYKKMADD